MWLSDFVEIFKSAAQIFIYLFLSAYLLICAALSMGLLGNVLIRAFKATLVNKSVEAITKENASPISGKVSGEQKNYAMVSRNMC